MGTLAQLILLIFPHFLLLTAQEPAAVNILQQADDHPENITSEHPELVSSINKSLNPCDDFYSYVCDGWIKEHPIPETKRDINQMGDMGDRILEELKVEMENLSLDSDREQSLAKIYYLKCIENFNNTSNEGVNAMLAKLRWMRRNILYLTDWLIEMAPEVAVYNVYVAPDELNSTTNIITISPAETTLSYASYFDPAYAEEYVVTRRSLFELLSLLAVDDQRKDVLNYSPQGIWHKVEHFFTVDRNLAKIIEEAKSQPGAVSIPLVELTAQLPSVDWLRYFSAIFPPDLVPSLPRKFVSLRDAYVIFKIEEMVTRMPPRWFIDYLEWKVIFRYAPFFDHKYNSIVEKYNKQLYGTTATGNKEACLKATVGKFADVLSAIWVEKYFDKTSVAKVMTMVDIVRANFLSLLEENTWMDEATKSKAREKAHAIKPFIGYDPYFISPEKIKENYALVNYNMEANYYTICEALERNLFYLNLKTLGKFNKRDTFEAMPIETNAFYDPSQNQIAVLAGILREPYYNPSWPELLNFAGIGMVIGHEITHAFDNEGSYYDAFGNRVEWWNPKTRDEFDKKKQCIEDEYGSTEVLNGVRIDGSRTLGENIADNGGMRIVVRSALNMNKTTSLVGLEQYSSEQIFFMSYAMTWCSNQRPFSLLSDLATETHSPPKYRVNIVLANQPEFASAFNCPLDSPMNPSNKCTVW